MTSTSPEATREASASYLTALRSLILPQEILDQKGYIVRPLSDTELFAKRKCDMCGASCKIGTSLSENIDPLTNGSIRLTEPDESSLEYEPQRVAQDLRCRFHPGYYGYVSQGNPKQWTCCGQRNGLKPAKPCRGRTWHVPRSSHLSELKRKFEYHTTPQLPTSDTPKSIAVAVDCEMGTNVEGNPELIRVTVVDYFSTAILLDALVYPTVPMTHFNTKFSGVTRGAMESARRKNCCIMGRDNARRAVWKHVGPNTVVIGHSANNDLTALRWIHENVVDTLLIAKHISDNAVSQNQENETLIKSEIFYKGGGGGEEAAQDQDNASVEKALSKEFGNLKVDQPLTLPPKKHRKGEGPHALKTLCRIYLGREIQSKQNRGHDSLEDAIAARDLAHLFIMSSMAQQNSTHRHDLVEREHSNTV